MSHAGEVVLTLGSSSPVREDRNTGSLQDLGERFTPLLSRDSYKTSQAGAQRGDEAFFAICFPGWKRD